MNKTIYVLTRVGFGAEAYSEDFEHIKKIYNDETDNDRFGGFFIHKLEITENVFKMNNVDFWGYLKKLCTFENMVKL